ncbi:MAG: Hsp20/alpha crystallin family protein [Akkermansiaceae bacterium]
MNLQLEKWDPMKEFNQLGQRLSSFFEGKNDSSSITGELFDADTPDWKPACDITEDEQEYLVTADLPEVKKDEVKVNIDNGVISISGERKTKSEKKDKDKKYHRIERSYGSYQRSFRLPENVKEEGVKAEFKDGVLRVHLPKGGDQSQKNIQIN